MTYLLIYHVCARKHVYCFKYTLFSSNLSVVFIVRLVDQSYHAWQISQSTLEHLKWRSINDKHEWLNVKMLLKVRLNMFWWIHGLIWCEFALTSKACCGDRIVSKPIDIVLNIQWKSDTRHHSSIIKSRFVWGKRWRRSNAHELGTKSKKTRKITHLQGMNGSTIRETVFWEKHSIEVISKLLRVIASHHRRFECELYISQESKWRKQENKRWKTALSIETTKANKPWCTMKYSDN